MLESLKHLIKVYFSYLKHKDLYRSDLRKAKQDVKNKYYTFILK